MMFIITTVRKFIKQFHVQVLASTEQQINHKTVSKAKAFLIKVLMYRYWHPINLKVKIKQFHPSYHIMTNRIKVVVFYFTLYVLSALKAKWNWLQSTWTVNSDKLIPLECVLCFWLLIELVLFHFILFISKKAENLLRCEPMHQVSDSIKWKKKLNLEWSICMYVWYIVLRVNRVHVYCHA